MFNVVPCDVMLSEAGNIEYIGCVLLVRALVGLQILFDQKRESVSVTFWPLCLLFVQMNELSRAEEALTEANHLDTKNPDVWAYLSLMCLKVELGKTHTHSRNFNTHSLYSENKHLAARTRSKVEINLLFFLSPSLDDWKRQSSSKNMLSWWVLNKTGS